MANLLTGIRLLLVIPVTWGLADRDFLPGFLLLSLIVVAIVTDYYDGIVARRTGTASPSGQLFDHATDFIFVTCGLFGLAAAGIIAIWLPVLIVIAFSQYVLDSYLLFHQKQLRMSTLGRWNGVCYFAPLILVASSRLTQMEPIINGLIMATQGLCLLLILSTLLSIADRAVASWR